MSVHISAGTIRNSFATVLLLLHAWIVFDLSRRMSATYNESSHIVAGLACWHTGAYHFYNVNPPLPRMVSTAILLLDPELDLEALRRIQHIPGTRDEREVGMFFADTNASRFHRIVCLARLAGVFWVTLGGIVVWRWACILFGPDGGLLALGLWTFEPTVTAHAALVTGDVPGMVMGLAASLAFWAAMRSGSYFHSVATGILLGLALLCKFTLVLLLPAWSVAWLLVLRSRDQYAILALPLFAQLRRSVVVGFLAWATLNSWYEFRGTGTRIGDLQFFSKSFQESPFIQNSLARAIPLPLPTDFVLGMDLQQRDFEGALSSYLFGEWRSHGWWYYYVYAFVIKSPFGHLAVYFLAVIIAMRWRTSIPVLLWLIPAILIAIASMKSGYTNSLRYLLPAYPFIFIMSGCVVSFPTIPMFEYRKWMSAILVCYSAGSMWSTYPNSLGYFNESVGGVENGWRYLAGSNVDWGQDWIALRKWLDTHPNSRPIKLSLVGVVDPIVYLGQRFPAPDPFMSGYAVVDAQSLTGSYPWLLKHPIVGRIGASIFVFEVRPAVKPG